MHLTLAKQRVALGSLAFTFLENNIIARIGTISDTPINGGLLIRSSILDVVVSSAAEAELGSLFENMRDATILGNILLANPQPARITNANRLQMYRGNIVRHSQIKTL